ncbi:MAG TPA: hypothetical protein VE996_03715 [Terriglobales bacterium]|nr:hypothetical protein [Terriglobales bacterium]
MAKNPEQDLAKLTEWLSAVYGSNLVSLLLFGSMAGGNHHRRYSDVNLLAVLEDVEAAALERGAEAFRWWERRGHRPVTIFSRAEAATVARYFPIESLDLRHHRRILAGSDPFADGADGGAAHRWHVEHDLRSRLLRLRARYVALAKDRKGLERLLLQSGMTFVTLLRHALAALGAPWSADQEAVARAAGERFGFSPEPFLRILAARRGERPLPGSLDELRQLFAAYLAALQQVERQLEEK